MFKKTMTFDDLDGNEVTQTFYFNYNKKEIAELLEFKQLEEKLALLSKPVEESGLTQVENNQQAYDIFQDLILDAYGEKGADNVTFVKNENLREYWKSHVAFVELIFEFLENPRLGAQFVENCLPAKMVAKAKEDMAAENENKLTSETLMDMVEEADRRQKDPATRIEPGVAPQDADEDIKKVAVAVVEAQDADEPAKRPEDLTPEDIRELDDIAFKKLDVKKLSREAMLAAFERKNRS